MSKKNEQPKTPPAELDKVGYGKPPKHSQFQKGKSGNPKGRPKADKKFKSMDRVMRDGLLEEIEGRVNGKQRKMLKFEAVIGVQIAKALNGDTRAAKLVIELAQRHVPHHLSIQELTEGRPLFTFTEKEAARFRKAKTIEGMVVPKKDDNEGQPVL